MKRGCDKDLDIVYVVLQCRIRHRLFWLLFLFCRPFPVLSLDYSRAVRRSETGSLRIQEQGILCGMSYIR